MATKKQQQQAKKKKAREKQNQQKLTKLRDKKREKEREELLEWRNQKRVRRLKRQMEGLEKWADEVYSKLPEKTIKQLEHNAKILQALEDEYEKETASRRDLQQELKDQGCDTLEEMVELLHTNLAKEQGQLAETAEVEVIKAPVSDQNKES